MEKTILENLLDGADVTLRLAEETVSTNTDAKTAFREGCRETLLLTADRQTGGRGRSGKTFLSPESGLYMSLLLPGERPLENAVGVTSCAAAAVLRAIRMTSGAECGIKWVNDLYLDGRKLCGILCESVNDPETMTSRALIVGVGINLTVSPTVTDSEVRAVSLAEAGFSVSREALCAAVTKELLTVRDRNFDFAAYADEYRRASLVLGREITFTKNGLTRTGTAEAIDDHGGLSVRCGNENVLLDSGEIHVRL